MRRFVLIFFDDILIYSATIADHREHLRQALKVLRENHLYANLSKSKFGCLQVDYLGHLISEGGITVDPRKVQVIKDWSLLKTPKALRGFLGLTGYYRKFVISYRSIAALFNKMLKNDGYQWTEESRATFEQLKVALMNPPILSMPKFNEKFILKCDASNTGVGAVLMQGGHPIAYISQGFKGQALALSTFEKEMLAILLPIQK